MSLGTINGASSADPAQHHQGEAEEEEEEAGRPAATASPSAEGSLSKNMREHR